MTQTALGSHPQHRLQGCMKKRIPSNFYQSHVSNSFCCETNSKRVIFYFNTTTSAVLLHLKKSMSTLREIQEPFFFPLTLWKMDSLLAVILPQPQFQKQQQIRRDFSRKNKHSLHHFIHLFIKIKLPQ